MEVRVLSSAPKLGVFTYRACLRGHRTDGGLGPKGACVLRLESDGSVDFVHSRSSLSSHTRVLASAPGLSRSYSALRHENGRDCGDQSEPDQ